MSKIIIFVILCFFQHALATDITLELENDFYGQPGYSPFPEKSPPKNPYTPSVSDRDRVVRPSLESRLYSPKDHPKIVAYKKQMLLKEQAELKKVQDEMKKFRHLSEQSLLSLADKQAKLVAKYRHDFLTARKLEASVVQDLMNKKLIKAVIKPYELSEANGNDGLNAYRKIVYGDDTSLYQRQIIRMQNYHQYSFREARWRLLKDFESGELTTPFKDLDHFQGVELLSRATTHYAAKILQKKSLTSAELAAAHSLLDDAKSLGDFAQGFSEGVKVSTINIIEGVPTLIKKTYASLKNYEETLDLITTMISQFEGDTFIEQTSLYLQNRWGQFVGGNAYQRGEILGGLTTDVVATFIPSTHAIKVAKVAEKFRYPLSKLSSNTRIGQFLSSLSRAGAKTSNDVFHLSHIARKTSGGTGEMVHDLTKVFQGDVTYFGPINAGPLHMVPISETKTVADTFRSASYVRVVANQPTKLYRVSGTHQSSFGPFWSKIKPQGPMQATLDLALDPKWKNPATHWVEVTVPKGQLYYEGVVSEILLNETIDQASHAATGRILGGGNQIYIPAENVINPSLITDKGLL